MRDVALIGCGDGGERAASAWRSLASRGRRVRIVQELRAAAAGDSLPDREAGEADEGGLASPPLDLDDRASLVVITGDAVEAGDVAVRALRAGRSVAIERPFRLGLPTLEALSLAMREAATELRLVPLLPLRFDPAWRTFEERMHSGVLGVCRSWSVQRLVGGERPRTREHSEARWARHHGEVVDFLLRCFDPPTQVACSGVVGRRGGVEHSTTLYRLPRHDAPAEVVVETATDLPPTFSAVERYVAVFERGTLDYDSSRVPSLRLHDEHGGRSVSLADVDADLAAAEASLDVFEGTQEQTATIDDAFAVAQLLEAERRAVNRGEPVEVKLRGG